MNSGIAVVKSALAASGDIMSSFIVVYAIDPRLLGAACGSRDASLITAVLAAHQGFLKSVDDATRGDLSCGDAVRDLVNGAELDIEFGSVYGYAYEALCLQLGEFIESHGPIAGRSGAYIQSIDDTLGNVGIDLKLAKLCFGGPLVRIPETDDGFPSLGYWTADELLAALPVIRSVNLSALEGQVSEDIQRIRSWVESADPATGRCLVGVLS